MNPDTTPMVPDSDRPTAEQLRAELDRITRKSHGRGFLRFLLILLLLIAILAAAVLLLFPAFVVYGNSMAPALHEGDLVLAASDPYPGIGDLVAFRSGERVLIKRVVACPGDSVEVLDDGRVLVNGEKLSEPYALYTGDAGGEMDYPVTLPDGGYFVLGDNRGSSVDSRYRVLGIIDENQLLGRLVIRLWPLNRIELLVPDAFQALLHSVKLPKLAILS
jgi:signal peptidase I